ncbi:hypothetical protein EDB80DRAFT_520371, partial [Ilyonectria destructans]
VWSVATALRQELSKKLESGTKNDMMGLMAFVGDWRSFVKDQAKKSRTYSWEISNLGVINGEVLKEKEPSRDGERWTIERAVFTQSAVVAGPAICLNLLAVKGRALSITCSWQTEVVNDGLARAMMSDLKMWLNRLG